MPKKQDCNIVDPTKNYYDILPDKFKNKPIHYANEKALNISLPAQIGLFGTTGSGKTQWVMNFIENVDIFERITIYAKNLQNDPLYLYLEEVYKVLGKKAGRDVIDVFDNIDNVIPAKEYSYDMPSLVIIDDFMNEPAKKLGPVIDLFSMGRKNGVTVIWITQSYFQGTPMKIRQNIGYSVFFKIESAKDIARIVAEKACNLKKEQLVAMYDYVREQGDRHFFLIDGKTNNPALKYRMDYTPFP